MYLQVRTDGQLPGGSSAPAVHNFIPAGPWTRRATKKAFAGAASNISLVPSLWRPPRTPIVAEFVFSSIAFSPKSGYGSTYRTGFQSCRGVGLSPWRALSKQPSWSSTPSHQARRRACSPFRPTGGVGTSLTDMVHGRTSDASNRTRGFRTSLIGRGSRRPSARPAFKCGAEKGVAHDDWHGEVLQRQQRLWIHLS